jgi:hypothetical protein
VHRASEHFFQPADHIEPVGARHLEVDDREIRRRLLGLRECLLTIVRGDDLIPGARQTGRHLPANHDIIVDHEHAHTGRCGFARWRCIDRHRCC